MPLINPKTGKRYTKRQAEKKYKEAVKKVQGKRYPTSKAVKHMGGEIGRKTKEIAKLTREKERTIAALMKEDNAG